MSGALRIRSSGRDVIRRCRVVTIGVAAAILHAPTASCAALSADVRQWRVGHERVIVEELEAMTRIPSIAADPQGLSDAASALQSLLSNRGFKTRLLSLGPGAPSVVFGALDTPSAHRTVVFYAHYDGQPVTRADWASDPFSPVMRSGSSAPVPNSGLAYDRTAI